MGILAYPVIPLSRVGRRSKELSYGEPLESAWALGLSALGPESEAITVEHGLADGNRLEAAVWSIEEREVLVA